MAKPVFQPYQVLFPVGVLYALAGVLAWTLHAFGGVSKYPGLYHAHWMVGGFLLSFSAGFLMTAIPRFTGTSECRNGELALAAVLACGQALHLGFTAALLFFLLLFGASRVWRRKYSPPPHFVFVGLGLALGLIGASGMVLIENGVALFISYGAFRGFLFQGTLLCFVLGIGARLIRVLLGYEPSPLVQISRLEPGTSAPTMLAEGWSEIAGLFILMVSGFVLEAWPGNEILGRWIRAVVASWIAFRSWRLHALPPRRGALVWGLYLGCWSIVIGAWAYALFPGWEVHSAHILLVGGFATLALMVASRVTLAHGGYSLMAEVRSTPLRTVWILLLLAMGTRVLAPVTQGYVRHLGYAGAAAGIAFAFWGVWMSLRLRHSGSLRT